MVPKDAASPPDTRNEREEAVFAVSVIVAAMHWQTGTMKTSSLVPITFDGQRQILLIRREVVFHFDKIQQSFFIYFL